MKSCLIVIDAQVSFRHRDYFTNADLPAYLSAQNQLIAGAWEQAIPIIRIFHCDGPAITSNPWSKESGYLIDLCFVILPDTLLMDWAGPAEAFHIANKSSSRKRLRHALTCASLAHWPRPRLLWACRSQVWNLCPNHCAGASARR